MVKHIILWKLKDTADEIEKNKIKSNIKINLEALVGKVPGLVDVKVIVDGLDSSNADVLLDSTLESKAALTEYANHPEHVAVADTYVRPYTSTRICLDYEV